MSKCNNCGTTSVTMTSGNGCHNCNAGYMETVTMSEPIKIVDGGGPYLPIQVTPEGYLEVSIENPQIDTIKAIIEQYRLAGIKVKEES